MGIGSFDTVNLADAREAARTCRKQLQDGLDLIEAWKQGRAAALAEAACAMTFSQCAAAYIAAHKPSWQNAKHAKQWTSTLATYVEPIFGSRLVKDINTSLIMEVLDPIWHLKRETASRLCGRMEAILDWATVRGYLRDPSRQLPHWGQQTSEAVRIEFHGT